MEMMAANRLTQLFKGRRHDQRLQKSEISISLTTASGSEITVKPSTPYEAAQYLRLFMDSNNPLLKPGPVHCDTPTFSAQRPGSIVFKGDGQWRESQYERHVVLFQLKFTGTEKKKPDGEENVGILSLREHFGDDVQNPIGYIHGPTILQLISTLYLAGNSWDNVEFKPGQTTPQLKLVK